ncbi:MAG: hypothetical protein HC927_02070 [Deltaproteobacteria bacterium]|nr:hypothetical protein [Deltaproteobacteria bacterium]
MLAVARLAHDYPSGLTPELLAEELIGSQVLLCRRIIERCIKLGLLEQWQRGRARLSPLGEEMLQRGQVLVPEQGEWRIYFVVDPLVDDPVMHVRPLPSTNGREERTQVRQRRTDGQRIERGTARPRDLAEHIDTTCTSLVDGSTFRLIDIAPQGARGSSSQLRLNLEYAPDAEPCVTVRGRLDNSLSVDHALGSPRALRQWSYDELWTELVGITEDLDHETLAAARTWAGRRVLPVGFDRTQEVERRQLARHLEVPETEFDDLGEFESTRLADVELIPRTAEDAERWARWLQWDELFGYRVPAQLHEAATHIASRFPLFRVQLCSPDELLARAKAEPHSPRARALLTPADLGLWI